MIALKLKKLLLIAPVGIEMQFQQPNQGKQAGLLIAPVGIEISTE